jgi:hypothetical protein
MRDRVHPGMRMMAVRNHTLRVRIPPCSEAVPGRRTHRRLVEAILKTDRSFRKPVQIRRIGQWIPETAQGIESMVVTHQYKNVH